MDRELIKKVQRYMVERFGPNTVVLSIDRLGKGVHGIAFRIRAGTAQGERSLIMKTLFPSGFGHDHFSDRAQVLLLANAAYNGFPNHVQSLDVVGETRDRFLSLGGAGEFYLFMEEARGESYFQDLNTILKRGYLTDLDKERAAGLGSFIAEVHALKYSGDHAGTLYRRRIRDLIGHGECIMGIIDAYEKVAFADDSELVDFASKCLPWWGKIRDRWRRLARVHGDYHPGNIRFDAEGFTLLDRSRGEWGEPADDFSCLGLNYIHYALKDRGAFEGPFADLFRCFSDAYLQVAGDGELFEVVQPFFAFRILVVANPVFYPDDTMETKRRLFELGKRILSTERFDVDRIADYVGGP
jgi:hypothetical protein